MILHHISYEPDTPLDSKWRIDPQVEVFAYLANFGHHVVWVIPSEVDRRVEPFFFRGAHVYVTPCLQGTSLLRKIIKKVPNFLREMRLALRVVKEENCNIILTRDCEDVVTLIGAWIKRRYGIPWVFQIVNPPEMGREIAKIEGRKPMFVYHLIASMQILVKALAMKKADLFLPTSRRFKEQMVEQGISESKIMPYPNGVDMNLFSNRDGAAIRSKYHLDDSEVIIYVGTLARARYLSVLIQAFAKVRKERKNVKLLMVGQGNDEENLRRLAIELGVGDDVIFTGPVTHSEVPDFIAAADIGVSPVPPLSFYITSSPIKQVEYMAMAKPVVANEEIPEHKTVVEESGGGILVSFTPEAFADAIIELVDNPERATEMGRRGREWVVKHRTYEILARRIEQRFLSIVKQKSDNIA